MMGYFVDDTGQLFEGDDSDAERLKGQGLRAATPDDITKHNAGLQATAAPAAPANPPDAGATLDAGAPVAGYFVQEGTGRVFQGNPDEAPNLAGQGMRPATTEDIVRHNEEQLHGGEKLSTWVESQFATVAEAAEAASKGGLFQPVDPLTGTPIGRGAIDPTSGKLYPGAAIEASELVPFAYTPSARARRRINPNTAAASAIPLELALAPLIPQVGFGGLVASAVTGGLIAEANASAIDEDEYSLKDAALAAGGAFALEGVGGLAIKAALRAKGAASSYLDNAVERARRAATEGVAAETDAARAAEKMRRNHEALYDQHQTSLDEALSLIDERTAGAPERMFTPGALRKTVSQNTAAQEEAFLDMAVKFDQASQVADVPGLAEVSATLQGSLGKSGAGMFEAMRVARQQLDALGAVDNPLVREAAEALDASLRSQPTWGAAAKNYGDIADDLGAASDTVTVNLREPNARDVLDQRLDRARRMASLTGDKKLKVALQKAEAALENADKVTGARILGETTPAEIAQLQKKLDGFEKRAPKLAKELKASHAKLQKQLGVLGEMTDDEALDYVAARASGLGGKADPLRDAFVKAEKKLAEMKAAQVDPTKVARATSALKALREAVAEVHEIPRAAQRVRDWTARPGTSGKVKQAFENVPIDEIQNVAQGLMPATAATVGGAVFGIPGYIGGYLGGRLLYKRFGRRISEAAWERAKKEIGGHALAHPGEAALGAAGAFAGGVLAHGNAVGAAVGYAAGRKAGQVLGSALRRPWRKRTPPVRGASPPTPPVGSPISGGPTGPAPAPKGVTVNARAATTPSSRPDMDLDKATTLNRASARLRDAMKSGNDAAKAAARAAYERALAEASRNPVGVALAGLGAAGAAVSDDKQTQGVAAASVASASAGLLLLLLPRNIGRRAAFRQFEEAAAAAARRVHGTELPHVRRALEEVRPRARNVLRTATTSTDEWTPSELLDRQLEEVRAHYAEGARPGEWRAGNAPGVMSDDAQRYARAELARMNAGWVNGDAELRRTYDAAAREADVAERAPRGDDPSPRAQELDRANDLNPERSARLEQEARNAWRSLDEGSRDLFNRVMNSARAELEVMARRYVRGEELSTGLARNGEELIEAQIGELQATWERGGYTIPANVSAVAIQNAAEAELRRMNASIAEQFGPTRVIASPGAGAGDRVALLSAGQRDAALAAPRFARALSTEELEGARQALAGAADDRRALVRRFLAGEFDSPRDLLTAQTNLVREHASGLGFDRLPANRQGLVIDYVRATLRSANADEASALASVADEAAPAAAPPGRESTADIAARVRSDRAARATPFHMRRETDLSNERTMAWTTSTFLDDTARVQALGGFENATPELRRMFEAYVSGEPYVARLTGREYTFGDRYDLVNAQDELARAYVARAMGRTPDDLPNIDRIADAEISLVNAVEAENVRLGRIDAEQNAEYARQDERRAMLLADARRREAEAVREQERLARRERELKPSDENPLPATIDGIPTEAAFRLDNELLDPLERMGHGYDTREVGHDSAFLDAMLPEIEEAARRMARDNPNLIDEEAALGYARRRHAELAAETRENAGSPGPVWHALEDEGGYARHHIIPEPDDEAILEELDEFVREQAYDAGGDEYASLSLERVRRRFERGRDISSRERRRLDELFEERADQWERDFDEIVSEDRRLQEEELEELADEEPDSAPDSDDGYGSERETYRSGNHYFTRGDADGLPSNETLAEIGLQRLDVTSNHGIERVFGRELEVDEVEKLFSLKHVNEYAASVGERAHTALEVTGSQVRYAARAGDLRLDTTYSRGSDGIDIYYGFMKLPEALQGSGTSKKMIGDMIEPIESLGGGVAEVSAAWLGKYAWLKLGLQPHEYATKEALKGYKARLVDLFGADHPAVAMSMSRILNTRDLADAYLPADLVREHLPELRQAWEERRFQWSSDGVALQPFEEGAFRKSRSGNEQFLSGKYFLVLTDGSWNSGLSIRIDVDDEWYKEFKARLGLSAGLVLGGLGLHELNAAFTGTDMHVTGIGGTGTDGDTPDEVAMAMAEQMERAEQVDRTREKLGYLKTESEIIARDTARAVASPGARERVVAAKPGVTTSQGVARFLGSNGSLAEAYADKRDTLVKLQQNPMLLVDELTEGLAEVQDHAPDLHTKMVAQTYKVVQFLQGKLPSTIGASLTRPEGSPPNALAVRQFALFFSAATDPSSVMGDLANNRARKEQIDTLREVWPDVYDDLKMKVVEQLAQGRPTVSQRNRLDLLFDLGENFDRGLSPRLVATLAEYRARQGGPGGAGGPGGKQAPSRRSNPSVGGSSALGALQLGPAAGPGTLA